MCPDALANVETVGIREHNIQEYEVGPFPAAEFDSTLACLGASEGKTFFLEVIFEQRKEIGIIFDQGNFFHRTSTSSIVTVSVFTVTEQM
jgi:hypothetical protein